MLEKAVDADVAITKRDGIVRLASSLTQDQRYYAETRGGLFGLLFFDALWGAGGSIKWTTSFTALLS